MWVFPRPALLAVHPGEAALKRELATPPRGPSSEAPVAIAYLRRAGPKGGDRGRGRVSGRPSRNGGLGRTGGTGEGTRCSGGAVSSPRSDTGRWPATFATTSSTARDRGPAAGTRRPVPTRV